MNNIKVGDLVETCSLLPGVVMNIYRERDEILVRMLDVDDYKCENKFSSCSLSHCGIVKITAKQALKRLQLGREKLSVLWRSVDNQKEYHKLIDNE